MLGNVGVTLGVTALWKCVGEKGYKSKQTKLLLGHFLRPSSSGRNPGKTPFLWAFCVQPFMVGSGTQTGLRKDANRPRRLTFHQSPQWGPSLWATLVFGRALLMPIWGPGLCFRDPIVTLVPH